MKIGQHVNYIDGAGERHTATITEISGTGKSTCKILDLTLKDKALKEVPHERDAAPGEAFWREVGARALPEEERPAAEVKEKEKKKPVRRRK